MGLPISIHYEQRSASGTELEQCIVGHDSSVVRLVVGGDDLVLLRHLLQCVPLGNWATRVGEHVAPVPQFCAGCVTTEYDATNRLRRADAIIVNHRQDEGHLLQRAGEIVAG